MGKKKKILIVDDEYGFARLLKTNLEFTGNYKVETENTGKWAADIARRFKPDMILLDVVMPDISGRDVAEQMAADPDLKDIPVVFVTATLSREDAAKHQGVINGHRCLSKPVSIEDVIKVIEVATQAYADDGCFREGP